jgi:hypothetical protein
MVTLQDEGRTALTREAVAAEAAIDRPIDRECVLSFTKGRPPDRSRSFRQRSRIRPRRSQEFAVKTIGGNSAPRMDAPQSLSFPSSAGLQGVDNGKNQSSNLRGRKTAVSSLFLLRPLRSLTHDARYKWARHRMLGW